MIRRLFRWLAPVWAVALAVALALAPSAAAAPGPLPATDALPPAARTVADSSSNLRIGFTELGPGALAPGGTLTATVKITNTGTTAHEKVRATLRLTNLLVSRSAVRTWLEGRPGVGTPLATEEALALAPGASAEVKFSLPADQMPLPADWGTRGVSVEAHLGDSPEVDVLTPSFIVWMPTPDFSPTQVAVVASLTAPMGDSVGRTVAFDDLAAASSEGGHLSATVQATRDAPVTWAVDPLAVRAAQQSADPGVRAWLDAFNAARTSAGAREILALPYADPDLVALARTRDPSVLDTLLAEGKSIGTLPESARQDVLWPVDGKATVDVVTKLATDGRQLLVGSRNLPPVEGLTTPNAHTRVTGSGGNVDVLVADDELSSVLTDLGGSANPVTVRQRLLGELAVITREMPYRPRTVVLTTGRQWTPDPAKARAVLDGLGQAPWVRFSTVADALASEVDPNYTQVTYDDLSKSSELPAALLDQALGARGSLLAFSKAVTGNSYLAGTANQGFGELASAAYRRDPQRLEGEVRRWVERADEVSTSVEVVRTSDLNLLTDKADLRFVVVNRHDEPVQVRVTASPSNTKLTLTPMEPVSIQPGRQVNLSTTATAIGSGETVLTLSTEAMDGTAVGKPVTIPVRIHVQWGNIATIVILAGAGLLVALGAYRTVHRNMGRRFQRSTPQ